MSLREEYVQLAMQVGSNRRELCRRFGTHSGPEQNSPFATSFDTSHGPGVTSESLQVALTFQQKEAICRAIAGAVAEVFP
jgi:hypothetical protein